jgi:hypothetical protein
MDNLLVAAAVGLGVGAVAYRLTYLLKAVEEYFVALADRADANTELTLVEVEIRSHHQSSQLLKKD